MIHTDITPFNLTLCDFYLQPARMPLNAGGGDPGYGSVAGPGLSGTTGGGSESAPLLIPVPELEPEEHSFQNWRPLSKEELEVAAGGPGWRKVRCYLVLLFWLTWLAMLAVAVAIIVMSPRPVVPPLSWWQKTLFYRLQPDLQAEGSEGINGEETRTLGLLVVMLRFTFNILQIKRKSSLCCKEFKKKKKKCMVTFMSLDVHQGRINMLGGPRAEI